MILFLWALLVLSFIVYLMMMHQYWQDKNSIAWPQCEGTVLESTVESIHKQEHADRAKAEFQPVVKYRYEVGGKTYTSEMYAFKRTALTYRDASELLDARFKKDQRVTVYFNPGDPAVAVLEPGLEKRKMLFMTLRYSAFVISLLFLIKILQTG